MAYLQYGQIWINIGIKTRSCRADGQELMKDFRNVLTTIRRRWSGTCYKITNREKKIQSTHLCYKLCPKITYKILDASNYILQQWHWLMFFTHPSKRFSFLQILANMEFFFWKTWLSIFLLMLIFLFALSCTVGHKIHDPCFHKQYMEAGVTTFVAHCTRTLTSRLEKTVLMILVANPGSW